eukprot:GGOE01004129.1.p1 GENE.GGOE01004129.1~~GGOE01004129.1.p1  ORF type:complete len:1018 (+),score=95.92 GGOE01004129.1:65-3118(+)
MSKKFTNVNIAQRIAQQQRDQQQRSQTAVVIPKQSSPATARIAILKVPKAKKEGKSDAQPTPASQPSVWATKPEESKDPPETSEKKGGEEPSWGDESGEMDFTELLPGMGDQDALTKSGAEPKPDTEIQLRPQRPMHHPQQQLQKSTTAPPPPVILLRRPQQPPVAPAAQLSQSSAGAEEPAAVSAPVDEGPTAQEAGKTTPEPLHNTPSAEVGVKGAQLADPAMSPPADKLAVADVPPSPSGDPTMLGRTPSADVTEPAPAIDHSPNSAVVSPMPASPGAAQEEGSTTTTTTTSQSPLEGSLVPSPQPSGSPTMQSIPAPALPPALLPAGTQTLPQFEQPSLSETTDNAPSPELGQNAATTEVLSVNGAQRRPKPYMPPKGGGLLGTMPPTGDLVSNIPYFSAQNVALLRQLQHAYSDIEIPDETAAFNANYPFALDLTGDGRSRASPLAGADLLTNMLTNAQNGAAGTADAPSPFRVVLRPARQTAQQLSQNANGKRKGAQQQGISGPPSSSPTSGDSNSWGNQPKDKQAPASAMPDRGAAAAQADRFASGKGDSTQVAWNEARGGRAGAPGGRVKRALWDAEEESHWTEGAGKPDRVAERSDERWREPLHADRADKVRHTERRGERERWGAQRGPEKERCQAEPAHRGEPVRSEPKADKKEETWASRRWASRKGPSGRSEEARARPQGREKDGEKRREYEGEVGPRRGKGQRSTWEEGEHRQYDDTERAGEPSCTRRRNPDGAPNRAPNDDRSKGSRRDRGQGKGKGRDESRAKAPVEAGTTEAPVRTEGATVTTPDADVEARTRLQKKAHRQRKSQGCRPKRDEAQAIPVDRQSASKPVEGSDDDEEAAPGRRRRAKPRDEVVEGGEQTERQPHGRRSDQCRRRRTEAPGSGEVNAADGEAIQAEGEQPEGTRHRLRRDKQHKRPAQKAEGTLEEATPSTHTNDADVPPVEEGAAKPTKKPWGSRGWRERGARRADNTASTSASLTNLAADTPPQSVPPPAPDHPPQVGMDAG